MPVIATHNLPLLK